MVHRDLASVLTRAGTHGCVVFSGTLHDPYTGRTIAFHRGETSSLATDECLHAGRSERGPSHAPHDRRCTSVSLLAEERQNPLEQLAWPVEGDDVTAGRDHGALEVISDRLELTRGGVADHLGADRERRDAEA